ncbi:MAG: DNA-formamidopyrimidine glycosylase [Steroidobacteraceae bacterium]|nr:DNA-formamidopyrimidine glycosylase [Deltaproteobacteria bacterium]
MPELPEVESVLRALRDGPPRLPGRVISRVCLLWDGLLCDRAPGEFCDELEGMTFSTILRHGKYLIFRLYRTGLDRRESFLIVHLRMTGRLYLVPSAQAIERHTRLALLLDENLALRFDDPRKFGRVWLVNDPDEVLSGLGPDALTVSLEVFTSRISNYQRQIKPLLLDQSFLAGIGNIYADESLFRAGIHPLTSSRSLTDRDVERLHRSVSEVLTEAVENNGANIDGVFEEGGFIVSVYGRTGKPCPRCGSAIIKIRVGQRGTHLCPACQPFRKLI